MVIPAFIIKIFSENVIIDDGRSYFLFLWAIFISVWSHCCWLDYKEAFPSANSLEEGFEEAKNFIMVSIYNQRRWISQLRAIVVWIKWMHACIPETFVLRDIIQNSFKLFQLTPASFERQKMKS